MFCSGRRAIIGRLNTGCCESLPLGGGHCKLRHFYSRGYIVEKEKYWPLTLAAFGGGCLLMAAVYFCLGWWPFGTGTVLTGDLRGLYVNYITDMWARVKQGGFFYSFGKLAGGSTLGLFAYYMNSPFNLLFLLLPTRMVPQAAGLIFLLRTGVTAAAFCWYLQRHFAKADPCLLRVLHRVQPEHHLDGCGMAAAAGAGCTGRPDAPGPPLGLYGAGLPLHFAQLLYRLAGVSVQHPVLFVPVAQPGAGTVWPPLRRLCGQRRAGGGAEFLLFAAGAFGSAGKQGRAV